MKKTECRPTGGLATLNSVTGELNYSGQYRAFKHMSKYIRPGAEIYDVAAIGDGETYSSYPKIGSHIQVIAAKNTDGSRVVVMCNPNDKKRQVECEFGGEKFYFELLGESVSTVIFD